MKENKIKDSVVHIKNYFVEMPKPKRIKLGIIAGIIVLAVVILTIVLNTFKPGYRVLYSNISANEASNVYQALVELGADTQLNAKGEVMVPYEEYDIWLWQLAEKGYPQTALSYDIFADHSGLTSTEMENKQWLIYQLQDRIQSTLKRIDGVQNATVTITIPEKSDLVWKQAEDDSKPTAAVLLSFKPGTTLLSEQVAGLKTLVAAGVPEMTPADVSIVDAKTMLELYGDEQGTGLNSTQNMRFEQMVQNQIEDNIVRALTPRYGSSGVVAVAKVTLDYDKMITERKELVGKPETNDGLLTHNEGQYGINGNDPAAGIVGEEDNTDIPGYAFNDPNGDGGMTDYAWSKDYDYGYIKTQIEKGNAILKRATVSVMVDENELTPARKTELISIVSSSADIPAELITVSGFDPNATNTPEEQLPAISTNIWDTIPIWVFVAAGAGLLLLFVVIFIITSMSKKKSKRRLAAKLRKDQESLEEQKLDKERELEEYKRQLAKNMTSTGDEKDEAIMGEVRSFAKDNPEITANLLRSWLKEDE